MTREEAQQMNGLDHWLDLWSQWMARDRDEIDKDCGWRRRSVGFECGGVSSEDAFDLMYDADILRQVLIVDRCINDLPGNQYAAICNRWMACVWTHRGSPTEVLEQAMVSLHGKCVKAGVIL